MNRHLKKVWPALAVSLVLATSCMNAADNTDMNRSKSTMDAKKVDMQKKPQGSMGMITPPVNPCVQGCDFSFGVEALYMRATQDSTIIGLTNDNTSPKFNRVVGQGYDWSWGARVDAGYAMDHDGWDLQGQWTWFHSSHTHNRSGGDGFYSEVIGASFFNGPSSIIESQDLNSHRRLLINMGDLDLGREFFISKWLVLRPHVGARGIWINDRLDVKAVDILGTGLGLDKKTSEVDSFTKNSYNAGGMYVGLDTQWGFGDGWSLFGNIDQALVYGRNTISTREVDYTLTGAKYTRNTINEQWNIARSITDIAIGLRWDYMFGNDSYRLRLQAAWEEHLFNNTIGSDSDSVGDLALTGASFKASFDF